MREAGSLCRSWENIGLSAGNEHLLWTILYPAPQDMEEVELGQETDVS